MLTRTIVLLLWGVVIPAMLLAVRQARRRSLAADLAAHCAHAAAIARFAVQCVHCAARHQERDAFFAALHALPDYAALLAKPAAATSARSSIARAIVLDMQAHMAQILRQLHARNTPLGDMEQARLRTDVKRLCLKTRQLHNPL